MSSQVFYTIYIMVKFPMNTNTLRKSPKCYNRNLMGEFQNNFLDSKIIFIMTNVCNKNSNKICLDVEYQVNFKNIVYNNWHFEPIEYTCDVRKFSIPIWNPISLINLYDYPTLSNQWSKKCKHLSKKKHFHWTNDLDFILINPKPFKPFGNLCKCTFRIHCSIIKFIM
jgi:hypothetical protein